MVKSGKVVMLANEIWQTDFDSSLYKSSVIFKSGDFLKVIFGRKDNERLMAVKNLHDLKGLSAITGHDWTIDITTLNNMGILQLHTVANYDLQLKMVKARRVDFGLLELSSLENSGKKLDEDLGILPGILIGLKGTRHFMVSKLHPDGKRVFQGLEKGIKILQAQGVIKKAMDQAGVYNDQIAGWKKIYPEEN